MSFEPPAGILDIGNATLRVGKLEVTETTGLNQGLQNIVKNDLLITETAEYSSNKHWGLKLPTTWVAEFEVKGETDKYVEFNFYNEGSTSNAYGYTLNFRNTTLTLKFDENELSPGYPGSPATIPTIVGTFRKVNVFLERGVIAVYIDGARVLYYKFGDGYNANLGVPERVISTTGSAFLNLFIEANSSSAAFKNLRIVNGRFISDKTSNVSFIGSLGVGVNSPKESLDIRGNMHFNRVSNVSQISVDSNVVTEYTGPHDRPLRKYPEVALSITSESASGENGYKVSWSSIYDNGNNVNERPFRVFDGDIGNTGNAWMVDNGVYGSDGTYAQNPPRNLGTATGGNSTTVDGEYIILQTPNKIKVKHFRISDKSTFTNRAAEAGKLYGSNDGSTWYELASFSELTYYDGDYFNTVHVNATTYYDRLALVVTNSTATSSSTYMSIGELEYYGYEEGSGSLDTTLKTVYNVPATTGTQLEVYYDGRETSSYSGSGATVYDISPNTNNGTLGTGVTFDSTYKAFVFDATGSGNVTTSKITSSTLPSTFIDDAPHSVGIWFKLDTITGQRTLFTIKDNTTGVADQTPHAVIEEGILRYDFWQNNIQLLDQIVANEWYHLVITFSGGNHQSGTKFYINGVHNTNVATPSSTDNLDIQVNSVVYVGGSISVPTKGIDGSIANFRLYSKVLNADQVKELYDYQKDYFLGSKSQVTLYKGHLGVGVTEPSGQLELVGDERIQSIPPRGLERTPREVYDGMTADEFVEGHGVFNVSASGGNNVNVNGPQFVFRRHSPFTALPGTSELNYWERSGLYNSSGTYTGTAKTSISGGGTLNGEWIQLSSPYGYYLKKTVLYHRFYNSQNDWPRARMPKDFTFVGSNNGSSWSVIKSFGNISYEAVTGKQLEIDSKIVYKDVRLIVHSIVAVNPDGVSGNETALNIGQWHLFGTPGPTTLDKGSLTLGRSLDVPRVSRYDVDTETPRPEKLLLDYDTTVNDSPTDISGRGNHGTFYNGTSYLPADKAFSFNATSAPADYIKATDIGNAGGLWQHSVSLWFKLDTLSQDHTLWFIDANGAGDTGDTPHVVVGTDGRIRFDMWGTAIYSPNNTIAAGTWYHVVSSLSATNNTKSLYINGTLIATHTTNIPHVVEANATLWIGSYGDLSVPLKGKISNFKVYDTVLEPSEVQKLYRLGRTGRSMVISDTAVGIGKVPETQLDVRGNIYTSGCVRQRGLPLLKACSSNGGSTPANVELTGSNWFDRVFVNQGNCFDLTTGRFYVPVAGYYRMFFRASATSMNVRFRKNGSDPGSTTGGTTEAYFNPAAAFGNVSANVVLSGSSEQLIYANVGDYLHLQVSSLNGVIGGVQHNVFTIYFVG